MLEQIRNYVQKYLLNKSAVKIEEFMKEDFINRIKYMGT